MSDVKGGEIPDKQSPLFRINGAKCSAKTEDDLESVHAPNELLEDMKVGGPMETNDFPTQADNSTAHEERLR